MVIAGPGTAQQVAMFRGNPARTGLFSSQPISASPAVLWRSKLGSPIRSSPAVYEDRVYVGSAEGLLYSLDLETRKLIQTGTDEYPRQRQKPLPLRRHGFNDDLPAISPLS